MRYWFTNPMLKTVLPLMSASAIKGLYSTFATPTLFMGSNLLPEGASLLPTPVDIISTRCPKKRAFLVTDESAERYAARIASSLEKAGFTTQIWNKAQPEAPLENVKESAEAMSQFEPDVIAAVGGGSVMDGAKAAWLLYERPDITDLANLSPLTPLMLRKKAFLVAVPTTSGTGSECTNVAVVHDHEAHRKVPITNPELMPDIALLVPDFTVSMPPKLTVGTGLDVLAHAMDCVPTPASNEITDALALASIEMVFKWLPRAYHNGQDREARYRMLTAASLAGIAFGQSGAALTHALGHSLGSIFNIHHGLAVGVFIPYTLQFYQPVTEKWLLMAKALEVKGASREESMANLVRKVRALFTSLNAPLSLKELNIPADEFEKNMEKLVLYSCEDICHFFSPRPMTADQCERIFSYAYEGKDVDF
jgi:alcohol dehydrogenase class IV